MPKRSSRQGPPDLNSIAFRIVEEATADESDRAEQKPTKDPLAVELGRRGGLKGGKARASKLTPEQRREIAKKAAASRWSKDVTPQA